MALIAVEKSPSRLMKHDLVEVEGKDDLEDQMEKNFYLILGIMHGFVDQDSIKPLIDYAARGKEQQEDLLMGFIYQILTDPKRQNEGLRRCCALSNGNFTFILMTVNSLISDNWLRLKDEPKVQLIWLCQELLNKDVPLAESTYITLLRQTAGGTVTSNFFLAERMLEIALNNESFFVKHSTLITSFVYTCLRLISDHNDLSSSSLQQKEIDACVHFLRKYWHTCMVIGKDLLRQLQSVALIPQFKELWKDMYLNPSSLSPKYTDISQMLKMRTSKKILSERLTPLMEKKLMYIFTKVKFSKLKEHQDSFLKDYLSTSESQSLRCDLIRYICVVFHPSNELLRSNCTPRWAVIEWLLNTCNSEVDASNSKLALFYDWLFFDPERDNIMNIEPAVLVMFHAMKQNLSLTTSLLDFMCRLIDNFSPPHIAQIKMCMTAAWHTVLQKSVVTSLSPLFENPEFSQDLKKMLHEHFPDICQAVKVNREQPLVKMSIKMNADPFVYAPLDITTLIGQQIVQTNDPTDLPADSKITQEKQCELADRLILIYLQNTVDKSQMAILASWVTNTVCPTFDKSLFTHGINEQPAKTIDCPLFVIFRHLLQRADDDLCVKKLLVLLQEIYKSKQCIGYMLLYFLKLSNVNKEKYLFYEELLLQRDAKDLKVSLLQDLQLCKLFDADMFTYLIPDIFQYLNKYAVGNIEILKITVSDIDHKQLNFLVSQVMQGNCTMFENKKTFGLLMKASLDWGSKEQNLFWRLAIVHKLPAEFILPVVLKLDCTKHTEALLNSIVYLKQFRPNWSIMKCILSRKIIKADLFTVSLINYWTNENEDIMVTFIDNHLSKLKEKKHKRSRKNMPTVQRIVSHLDHLKEVCPDNNLLKNEAMQIALQQANEEVKKKGC